MGLALYPRKCQPPFVCAVCPFVSAFISRQQEGLLSILFGLLTFFILPSTPSHVPFLTLDEKAYLVCILNNEHSHLSPSEISVLRDKKPTEPLRESGSDADTSGLEGQNKIKWREVWHALKLPHIWLIAFNAGFLSGATLNGMA